MATPPAFTCNLLLETVSVSKCIFQLPLLYAGVTMGYEQIVNDATREAKSITHKHILSIINTRLKDRNKADPIRILDAGCGNCELISFLQTYVPKFNQNMPVEVYGFDVYDSEIQFSDYFKKAQSMLAGKFSHIDWQSRLHIIGNRDPWPFDNDFFDVVVSNQVLEHIHDPASFLSQNWRILKDEAFAVHLFPLKNYFFEGHIHLPFAHRIKRWGMLYQYIKIMSKIGMGYWKRISDRCTLDEFAASYADFLTFYCHYLSVGDVIQLGKRSGFRTGFTYTRNFYYEKLKEIFRLKHPFYYSRNQLHFISIHFYKYIQCITLFLEKKRSYENYIAKYASR